MLPPATGGTVRLARHVLTFGPERHELLLHNSRGRLVLEAERLVPPFRPGRVDLGRGRFYDLTVPAPRLTARARFTPPGEAEIDLGEGAGLCVRAYSNTPDHDATAWFRLHTFDRELQLSLLEMTGSREQGYAHAGVLWVTRGRELLVRTSDPLRHFQDLQADAIGPFYPVPRSLRLSSAAAGLSGEAALRLVRRDDLLDWVDNALVRLLLGRAAHPVQYVFDTDYVFDITHGGRRERQAGTGVALFTLPGAPPKAEPW